MRKLLIGTDNFNRTIMIDDEDYDFVSSKKWNVANNKYNKNAGSYFSTRHNGKRIYLHRLLMNAPRNKQVDHIDGDTLNNTRANLRLATIAQNAANKHSSWGQYTRGVRKEKYSFSATSVKSDLMVRVTGIETAEEAEEWYKKIATLVHGEYAPKT